MPPTYDAYPKPDSVPKAIAEYEQSQAVAEYVIDLTREGLELNCQKESFLRPEHFEFTGLIFAPETSVKETVSTIHPIVTTAVENCPRRSFALVGEYFGGAVPLQFVNSPKDVMKVASIDWHKGGKPSGIVSYSAVTRFGDIDKGGYKVFPSRGFVTDPNLIDALKTELDAFAASQYPDVRRLNLKTIVEGIKRAAKK